MVDPSSAPWGYGFGRTEVEIEAEERIKRRRARETEPAVSLEGFEVKGLEFSATVKNVDNRPAEISNVLFLEVLEPPRTVEKKGLLFKRTMVKVAELISRTVRPGIFAVLPGETFTFLLDLAKSLEVGKSYVLELHMGEQELYSHDVMDTLITKLGWAYVLKLDEAVKRTFTMNLEQAGNYWGRFIARAKGKQTWSNIYVRFPWAYEHIPYEYY